MLLCSSKGDLVRTLLQALWLASLWMTRSFFEPWDDCEESCMWNTETVWIYSNSVRIEGDFCTYGAKSRSNARWPFCCRECINVNMFSCVTVVCVQHFSQPSAFRWISAEVYVHLHIWNYVLLFIQLTLIKRQKRDHRHIRLSDRLVSNGHRKHVDSPSIQPTAANWTTYPRISADTHVSNAEGAVNNVSLSLQTSLLQQLKSDETWVGGIMRLSVRARRKKTFRF